MKTLFKNGTVFDGSGNAPFVGDVLIEDNKILKVGKCDEAADETVDATGLYVCPGFIDAHSHNDFFCDRADNEKFFSHCASRSSWIKSTLTTAICTFTYPSPS